MGLTEAEQGACLLGPCLDSLLSPRPAPGTVCSHRASKPTRWPQMSHWLGQELGPGRKGGGRHAELQDL